MATCPTSISPRRQQKDSAVKLKINKLYVPKEDFYQLNFRIPVDLKERLDAACTKALPGSYHVARNAVLIRGLELAIAEIDSLSKK